MKIFPDSTLEKVVWILLGMPQFFCFFMVAHNFIDQMYFRMRITEDSYKDEK